jgi:hypothetical protein
MPYTYGTTNIKKNNYEIYVRSHKTAEIIDKDNKLKAMLQDISTIIALDENSTYADVTTVNAIYEIDMTGATGSMEIDMSNVSAIPGSDGDR